MPKESTDVDLLTYVRMLTDYVNVSNATLINVTATPGLALEFLEHRRSYFGMPTNPSPPTPPPHEGNPVTERPFFYDEYGVRIEIPQVARTNALANRYLIAGKMRGDPEEMPINHWNRAQCAADDAVLVRMHVRLLIQSEDSRTDLFMRLYGVTLDAAFKRFDVRSCFTEQMQNIRLECDPAPSPPPPSDWTIPPSPPVFAFELITLSTATGSSALFVVIGAVCCLVVGGRSFRARHNSRMIGTKMRRTDNMPYAREEAHRRGELFDGPVRNDLRLPARMLAETRSSGTSEFTFSTLVSNNERRQFHAVSTKS